MNCKKCFPEDSELLPEMVVKLPFIIVIHCYSDYTGVSQTFLVAELWHTLGKKVFNLFYTVCCWKPKVHFTHYFML